MEWERLLPEEYVGDVKKDDLVEIQISPGVWVPARVIHDMDTRISVKLLNPILVITKTRTLKKRFFSSTDSVEENDTYTNTWTSGRAYIRYPKK